MSLSRRQFITLGALCATSFIVQPLFACPSTKGIVEAAKTFVGSTKYKDDVSSDSAQLCFDIYRKAKVRLRSSVTNARDIRMLARHRPQRVQSLDLLKGSIMVWKETASDLPYFALYLGNRKILTSWQYTSSFIAQPRVTTISYNKASRWPDFVGYIPFYTIISGE
jgi:hypothetical protein